MSIEINPTQQLIAAFLALWPGAEWGPAHVVLSDWNLGDGYITSAIAELRQSEGGNQREATIAFLQLLLLIPEHARMPDYNESEDVG